jgi:glycerol-3-phosphate dehydrogenase (NAD(P)+)
MSEIVMQETCVRQVGSLGGPAYVEDLGRGSPGAAVIGSRFESVIARVQGVLASERLRVYGNTDLLGVELGGALMTVIILACGMARGLELGPAITAVVINRGLTEITRLGVALGAQAATFQGLSALGDLVAAALSGESRDFKLGERLARGETLAAALEALGLAESVPTARVALDVAARARAEVPIIAAMNRVLVEGVHPREIIRGLMIRRNTYEA